MMTPERFALTEHERDSALWKKIKAHYEKRLNTLRVQNDGLQDDEKTSHLRGRIAEVKAVLALNEPIPMPTPRE